MESRAKALGHPIHPMLVVFPLGLLTTSVIFDIIYLSTDNGRFADVAFWMIAAGIVGGLLAAVFGLIDWASLPDHTRAKRIGLYHGLANALALVLFAIGWFMRLARDPVDPGIAPFVLSVLGLACASIGGWLGGELVDRLGVGVDDGANLNAPNSITHRTATERGR